MKSYISCCHCGTPIYDGDSAYYRGVGDSHSMYCTNCLNEFLSSIKEMIDDEYGFEDGLDNIGYMFDINGKVYFDLNEFIDAEAERLADRYLNRVELFEASDAYPAYGYPEPIPSWSY